MLDGIKGAIFDMDGTLIDSMWVWTQVDIDFLKKRNIECPKDLKEKIQDLSFQDAAAYFKKNFGLKESIDEICNEWNEMAYNEYKENVQLKCNVKEYLDLLKSLNIKIGLATSNCNLLIEAVLKANGIFHYFDAISLTDEVSRGKQFPDIYLLTAKKLNVSPDKCIVFEDILPAVKGAKAAGMKVVAVYDKYSSCEKDEIQNTADKYIYKFSELM